MYSISSIIRQISIVTLFTTALGNLVQQDVTNARTYFDQYKSLLTSKYDVQAFDIVHSLATKEILDTIKRDLATTANRIKELASDPAIADVNNNGPSNEKGVADKNLQTITKAFKDTLGNLSICMNKIMEIDKKDADMCETLNELHRLEMEIEKIHAKAGSTMTYKRSDTAQFQGEFNKTYTSFLTERSMISGGRKGLKTKVGSRKDVTSLESLKETLDLVRRYKKGIITELSKLMGDDCKKLCEAFKFNYNNSITKVYNDSAEAKAALEAEIRKSTDELAKENAGNLALEQQLSATLAEIKTYKDGTASAGAQPTTADKATQTKGGNIEGRTIAYVISAVSIIAMVL